MPKSILSLVGAASIAATLPATIAAVPPKANCSPSSVGTMIDLNPGEPVTADMTWTGQPVAGSTTWDAFGIGFHSFAGFIIDRPPRKPDVQITLTWDLPGDYDIQIDDPATGEEYTRSENRDMESETFIWEDVEDCVAISLRVFADIGSPANTMTVTFSVPEES